jgi:hypothetical protein
MSASDEKAMRWLWAYLSPYRENLPMPQSSEEWAAIFSAADYGLVLPRLALAISPEAEDVPPAVADYLDAVLTMSRLRNEQLREQLVTLIKSLNGAGVTPFVIKGATTLLDESAEIGARSMLDMDVWTPDAVDQAIAAERLGALGYKMRDPLEWYETSQHFPPFFKDGELSRIELHHKMVNPRYSALVNEDAAAATGVEREFRGARFKLLDPRFALALSYMQCRWSCEARTLTMMKWLDLVDQCKDLGVCKVESCADLGVADTGADIDRRFLTALSLLTGLPYEGVKDNDFYDAWVRRSSSSVLVRFFKSFIGKAFDPRIWSDKSLADILKHTVSHLKKLPESYNQSKRIDRF